MKNLHLIYGDDRYQLKNICENIIAKNNIDKNAEVIFFNLINDNFNIIFNDFWIKSLFFEKKIIIIENFDFLFKEEVITTNILHLNKLSKNQNIFIFLYNNNFLKTTKETKNFFSKINIYNTKKINSFVIEEFVLEYLKKKNTKISNEALEYIILNSPLSLLIVKQELDKILNIKNNIDFNLVKKNFTNYPIGDIFKLINSIFYRNINEFKKNYLYIKNINNIENYVIQLIFENVRLLKILKLMFENNKSNTEIIQLLKIHPYRLQILKRFAKKYSVKQLDKILEIIYNYELNKFNIKCLSDYFHLTLFKIYRVGDFFGKS